MPEQKNDQKCAHPSCYCIVPAGAKYCSENCKKAPQVELHCNCMPNSSSRSICLRCHTRPKDDHIGLPNQEDRRFVSYTPNADTRTADTTRQSFRFLRPASRQALARLPVLVVVELMDVVVGPAAHIEDRLGLGMGREIGAVVFVGRAGV